MSNIQKYTPLDIDSIDATFREFEGGSSFMKFKEGTTAIRILPPPAGAAWKALVPGLKHYYKPPGAERAHSFYCPRNIKKPCPMCSKYFDLKESGNEMDAKLSRFYSAGMRVTMNVIDRENPGDGPKVWEAPNKSVGNALRDIARGSTVTDGEFAEGLTGDFTNITEGFDIAVRKKGQKTETEWSVIASRRKSVLSPDAAQAAAWINSQRDLNQIVTPISSQEIIEIMGGGARSAPSRSTPTAQNILDAEFTDNSDLPF